MKLDTEFYRLPLRFDVERLMGEVQGFAEEEWRPHPQGFPGNSALILVSAYGGQNDDMEGPMRPTDKLARAPYVRQVLASFDTVIGRSRLMRLGPQSDVLEHNDIHYYWQHRVRIHVPIVTDPAIRFWCNGKEVHMAPGESWIFDNWRQHKVINPTDVTRIHLVADTTGSSAFWRLVKGRPPPGECDADARLVPYRPEVDPKLVTERINLPVVMAPGEVDAIIQDIAAELRAGRDRADEADVRRFIDVVDGLRYDWRSAWSQHGAERAGWPAYRALIDETRAKLDEIPDSLPLPGSGVSAKTVLVMRLSAMLNPRMAEASGSETPATRAPPATAPPVTVGFDRPVFIVAAPRSGSTLLFETLARNRALWTIGDESHALIESVPGLDIAAQDFHSNRLTAADVDRSRTAALLSSMARQLRGADGRRLMTLPPAERPAVVRFLEKTPKNALRIPFFQALFPDALFVFLWRNPRDNISSIMDAWRSGRFVTYPKLPGWRGPPWSLLLPPGWRGLTGAPLEEIAAFQWKSANLQILDDLSELPPERWTAARYEDLIGDPKTTLARLCQFMDIPFGPRMLEAATGNLPHSRYTLTPPDPDKWRRNEAELKRVLPGVTETLRSVERVCPRQAEPAAESQA